MPSAGLQFSIDVNIDPRDWARKLGTDVEQAMQRALYRAGAVVQRDMMETAPYLFGNLRRSIGVHPTDRSDSVFVGVAEGTPASKYAARIERLTGFMAASLERKRDAMQEALQNELRRVIERR